MRSDKNLTHNSTCEKAEKEAKSSTGEGKSYPVLYKSIRIFRDLGHGLGQGLTQIVTQIVLRSKSYKKCLISHEIKHFLVETAGLEPVTSCV